jgi:hypothetical protein
MTARPISPMSQLALMKKCGLVFERVERVRVGANVRRVQRFYLSGGVGVLVLRRGVWGASWGGIFL